MNRDYVGGWGVCLKDRTQFLRKGSEEGFWQLHCRLNRQ